MNCVRANVCNPHFGEMREIPEVLIQDKSNLKRHWILILIGIILVCAAFAVDKAVSDLVQLRPGMSRESLFGFAQLVSKAGDWPVIAAAGAILTAFQFARRQFHVSRTMTLILLSAFLSGLTAAGNDGQQALDCPAIGNGVGEQCDVSPDGGR